jgi:hypothetical protein
MGQAIKAKKTGMKKDVPDIFLAYASQGYHGLFIELKRAKKSLSKVSEGQKKMIKRLAQNGYRAVVCYGANEAIEEVLKYYEK